MVKRYIQGYLEYCGMFWRAKNSLKINVAHFPINNTV